MEEEVTRKEIDYYLAQLSAYFALQMSSNKDNTAAVDMYKAVNKIKRYIDHSEDDLK